MNTRERLIERKALIMRNESSIYQDFLYSDIRVKLCVMLNSIGEYTYDSFNNVKMHLNQFRCENSIREKDKDRVKYIIAAAIKNKDLLNRIILSDRCIFSHMNVVFNSKHSLFIELKNIYQKYGINKLTIFVKIGGKVAKIFSFKFDNKGYKKYSVLKNNDTGTGICIHFDSHNLLLNDIELLRPVWLMYENIVDYEREKLKKKIKLYLERGLNNYEY